MPELIPTIAIVGDMRLVGVARDRASSYISVHVGAILEGSPSFRTAVIIGLAKPLNHEDISFIQPLRVVQSLYLCLTFVLLQFLEIVGFVNLGCLPS